MLQYEGMLARATVRACIEGICVELTKLKVKKRVEVGKKARKALKRDGYIPATMIGHGRESVSLGIPKAEFIVLLKAHHGEYSGILLDLEIEGNGGNQTVPTLVFSDGSSATNPSLRDVQVRVANETLHFFQHCLATRECKGSLDITIRQGGALTPVHAKLFERGG